MATDWMGYHLDFTGPQMLITIKLSTFAFDIYDGMKGNGKELSEYQKKMCLERIPTPLEYYGYIYFFAGFLSGPAFNLKEYLSFIDMSMFKTVNL